MLKPGKDNRSLPQVFAFLRATRWGQGYGPDEEQEELLYAQAAFSNGAYVAESKMFRGHVCLVQGGEDGCEADAIAAVVWGASETQSNADGVRDVVSLAAFDEAYASTQQRIRDAAARSRAAGD